MFTTVNFHKYPLMKSFVKAGLLLVTLMLVLVSCFNQGSIARQNTNYLYAKSSTELKPFYKVYHHTSDSSTVFFAIKPGKLLYINNNGAFAANVKVKYKLFNTIDDAFPIDTGSIVYQYPQLADTAMLIQGSFKLKAPFGRNYVAEVVFVDVNRRQHNTSFIEVDKSYFTSDQNYMLRSQADSMPVYTNYIDANKVFYINTNNKTATYVFVKYYRKETAFPPPPFSRGAIIEVPKPDTTFSVELANGTSGPLKLTPVGMFVITADTSQRRGLVVLRTEGNFPELTKPMDVLRPLRYLVSQWDYDKMVAKSDIKKEVDDFWLNAAANNNGKAREVLKNYYGGVRLANDLFTTTREGWKTDRGMILVIMGQPASVFKGTDTETWLYSTSGNNPATNYIFDRKPDGIAGYDYYLRRNDLLKTAWYDMVENWRNGRLIYWY
jgi:GWxTD domain-containing protein